MGNAGDNTERNRVATGKSACRSAGDLPGLIACTSGNNMWKVHFRPKKRSFDSQLVEGFWSCSAFQSDGRGEARLGLPRKMRESWKLQSANSPLRTYSFRASP
jgi:hypothetical protein